MHEALKSIFKDYGASDTMKLINKVRLMVEYLSEIISSIHDKDISRLKYLSSNYWKTILLAAKMENYGAYAELKSLLLK